ncbi:MAG TPA: (2Fe-2S)-binding protein [Ferrovibrio sp.]|jgi:bacterioferritin-associated ferredoxin|uniref:(2Fe-2S)-binding protein n=1 Tax=Ferrovibrio sp. TaxID=1917215 RepID=UPI002ED3755E
MYVCLCHGFTDGDVRKAIADGCRSVAAVYRHIADRPQCGKCVPDVRSMVNGQGVAEAASEQGNCCMTMALTEAAA